MFAYIYVIKNNMYPDDVYKLEVSRQNINQLNKKYNKYYMDNIEVMSVFLVRDNTIANKMLSDKLGKYFIEDTHQFVKCDFDEIKNMLVEIEDTVNSDDDYQQKVKNMNKNISDFMSFACKKNIGHHILINELYNLFDKEKTLDYLEFVYIIKKNKKIVIIEVNNKYFIENVSFVHHDINIFDQYVDQMIINSSGNFVSINQITLEYRKWHFLNYPFLKIPFKNELREDLTRSIEKKYGKISYNKFSIKCKNGWQNIAIK